VRRVFSLPYGKHRSRQEISVISTTRRFLPFTCVCSLLFFLLPVTGGGRHPGHVTVGIASHSTTEIFWARITAVTRMRPRQQYSHRRMRSLPPPSLTCCHWLGVFQKDSANPSWSHPLSLESWPPPPSPPQQRLSRHKIHSIADLPGRTKPPSCPTDVSACKLLFFSPRCFVVSYLSIRWDFTLPVGVYPFPFSRILPSHPLQSFYSDKKRPDSRRHTFPFPVI